MIARSSCLALLGLALAGPAVAGPADPWTIDAAASKLGFETKQMGVPVKGSFGKFSGTIVLDPANLTGAKIDITIEVGTGTTGTKDIDEAMTGPDLLAAKKFPAARFIADKVVSDGDGKYRADGKLTIRDASKDLALPFTLAIADDPAKPGQVRATARGRVDIKRLDYGVGQGDWKATDAVPNDVAVILEVVATRAK
ncbi:YceI family protein [Reyranella sp. CPCC 100927]|uniref:YceI family protein n=1 Tax=Reyranella sp. CPCC 100927 TaxID=2599616 RepID=UPI0015B42691|nr:YceI family protein [Reyranella sp. CPCC 100927]